MIGSACVQSMVSTVSNLDAGCSSIGHKKTDRDSIPIDICAANMPHESIACIESFDAGGES